MSVLDDLRAAQQRVTDRLAELEPLVKEYEELRAAAEQLNLTNSGTPLARRSAEATRRKPVKRRAAKTAKDGGQDTKTSTHDGSAKSRAPGVARKRAGRRGSDRATDIQRLVEQNPGTTVASIGKQLGVNPTSLYRPVKRLIQEGRLRKDGPQLQPAGTAAE